ncbi:MAG TPA: hypothetical protein VMV45_07345 [Casimicrobiaceae bacterium]|nr:hypothetical protein [Casimicrobiaceae bacterium]
MRTVHRLPHHREWLNALEWLLVVAGAVALAAFSIVTLSQAYGVLAGML